MLFKYLFKYKTFLEFSKRLLDPEPFVGKLQCSTVQNSILSKVYITSPQTLALGRN